MNAYPATNMQRPKDGLYLLGKNKHTGLFSAE